MPRPVASRSFGGNCLFSRPHLRNSVCGSSVRLINRRDCSSSMYWQPWGWWCRCSLRCRDGNRVVRSFNVGRPLDGLELLSLASFSPRSSTESSLGIDDNDENVDFGRSIPVLSLFPAEKGDPKEVDESDADTSDVSAVWKLNVCGTRRFLP